MKSETKSYSVFDDLDNSNPFEFTKAEPKHKQLQLKPSSVSEDTLCKALHTEFSLQGMFKIHSNLIVQYKVTHPQNLIVLFPFS